MNTHTLQRKVREAPYWCRNIGYAVQTERYADHIRSAVEQLGTNVYAASYGAPATFDHDGWTIRVVIDYDEGMTTDDMGDPLTLDEAYEYCRSAGASRSVAHDEARAALEHFETQMREVSCYVVSVHASREGVELGADSLGGVFILADSDYEIELWSAVVEHDMVTTAIEAAQATMARLCEAQR